MEPTLKQAYDMLRRIKDLSKDLIPEAKSAYEIVNANHENAVKELKAMFVDGEWIKAYDEQPEQRHACLDHGCQNCAHRNTLDHEPPCNSCAHNPYANNDPCRYEQPQPKRIEPLKHHLRYRYASGAWEEAVKEKINELIERVNELLGGE